MSPFVPKSMVQIQKFKLVTKPQQYSKAKTTSFSKTKPNHKFSQNPKHNHFSFFSFSNVHDSGLHKMQMFWNSFTIS